MCLNFHPLLSFRSDLFDSLQLIGREKSMLSANASRSIVGIIGNVICFGLFLSPIPTFVEICRKKSVELFSPIPYLTALANCMLWLFYGLPVVQPNTILISTINGIGVLVVIIYLTIFFFYSTKEIRTMVLKILAGEMVLMTMVVTLVLTTIHTHDVRSLIVGILSIIICVCMYASPLSILMLVMKTKSVKYMPFWVSLAGFLNGICWTSYALIKFDIFVLIPNGMGAILGLLELSMYAFYYERNPMEEHVEEKKIEIA